ncbi:YbaB/EbfC family nucleoid-associated protein [Clostridium sp. Cult3]|jgi:DNA-binding YbaB/EbfC family protein|uniref:YbaB/EbfC family nucleoid-associated protein n=1 Tax=Clostridium sp. Cult3 TaxID=2079004 RepID=UPI001F009CC5|nr:YbaB/EbfC family nucleoid-associated protein [Clostridium sp. Cult3]MCF6460144.1 YbaB/EbfC family nucleoid-associated protein [Clostridium sp. Cult3]
MARGGFPGMGNMGNMMKQMKKVQKQMEEMQKQLEQSEVEASAGGGAVTAKANGKKEIIAITIDESVVDPEDVEMLQDLVLAAVNEALRNAEELATQEMNKLTGGMNIPGLF